MRLRLKFFFEDSIALFKQPLCLQSLLCLMVGLCLLQFRYFPLTVLNSFYACACPPLWFLHLKSRYERWLSTSYLSVFSLVSVKVGKPCEYDGDVSGSLKRGQAVMKLSRLFNYSILGRGVTLNSSAFGVKLSFWL